MRASFRAASRAMLLVVLGVAAQCAAAAADKPIPLAGSWRFQPDHSDVGIRERWFDVALTGKIKLPGGLTEQGIGDPVTTNTAWIGGIVDKSWFTAPEFEKYRQPGNVKIPFWLQPELYYAGAAWFQRDIEIPNEWQGQRVVLFLERPHWETRVWVGGRLIGTNNALATPHEYDLGVVGRTHHSVRAEPVSSDDGTHGVTGPTLAPGKHTLTIRVDNRMIIDVGENSHSVSDHTQGNWNGIVGRVELRATPRVWIEEVQVYPSVAGRTAKVKGRIGNATGVAGRGEVVLKAVRKSEVRSPKSEARPKPDARKEVSWSAEGGTFELELDLGSSAPLWDEFNPVLHELVTTLTVDDGVEHAQRTPFGLRELATDGTQFTLNGRKTFFRGTLECAIFPKTGHPPTDVPEWRRIIGVARAHGLNMLCFHSWCPPEAAFVAADELGCYLQVECSSWANQSTTLGDGKPVDRWIYEEADRILKAYGNHPSFVLFLYGNEPGGANHKQFLSQWVEHYKARDPRRLIGSGAGWPELPENQFHVSPGPRIQQWGEGLKSRINARPPETVTDYTDYIARRDVPVISHEIGQWCVYPNFAEMKKYTGYLKARNFEIFENRLEAAGMGALAKQFLFASGKLQTLCYKEDIESALRTPGMGGFQLLDLHDFPGQGTALVGVLDPFWEEKGYVTPGEYSRFCNSVVPLARMNRRVFTTDETFTASLELANFGAAPLAEALLEWRLEGVNGRTWASGRLGPKSVPVDNGHLFGEIRAELAQVAAPAQGRLVVRLAGTQYENDWDLWVYPPVQPVAAPPPVLVTRELTDAVVSQLGEGGRVLLLIPPDRVKGDPRTGKIGLGFSSIFWNTAWTKGQPPHTLGILCDPKHPLFAEFPTESHSNWQWWYLIHQAAAMELSGLPTRLTPQVRVIDDWFTARPLGLLFEAKVGPGKLVVCSMDLERGLEDDPVRTQFRRSLLNYMAGRKFAPKTAVSIEQVRALMVEPSPMAKLGAQVIHASSAEAGHEPERLIDGDPRTFWHTRYRDMQLDFPHEFQISLTADARVRGVKVLPRQDGNQNGMIKDCEVYVSATGEEWGEPAWRGQLSSDPGWKQVSFTRSAPGRFLRFVARSGHTDGPWASAAEVEVIVE